MAVTQVRGSRAEVVQGKGAVYAKVFMFMCTLFFTGAAAAAAAKWLQSCPTLCDAIVLTNSRPVHQPDVSLG